VKIENLEELAKGIEGLSLRPLFCKIRELNQDISFWQQKDAFFWVLEKWLSEGRLKLVSPERSALPPEQAEDLGLPLYWEAEAESITAELRDKWPRNVLDENDDELKKYFFKLPKVIWIMPEEADPLSII